MERQRGGWRAEQASKRHTRLVTRRAEPRARRFWFIRAALRYRCLFLVVHRHWPLLTADRWPESTARRWSYITGVGLATAQRRGWSTVHTSPRKNGIMKFAAELCWELRQILTDLKKNSFTARKRNKISNKILQRFHLYFKYVATLPRETHTAKLSQIMQERCCQVLAKLLSILNRFSKFLNAVKRTFSLLTYFFKFPFIDSRRY